MSLANKLLRMHPAALVSASFASGILLGTLMLLLPISTRAGTIGPVDALFTATSAICVTGLTVMDTAASFTLFGQVVILILIQIGGLGIMTISVALFQWMGRSISFKQRMVMQDLFSHTPRRDILKLIKSIILFTVGAELMGTILLTIHWNDQVPFLRAVYLGLFHSVSAFCNAGFALFPDSFMAYSDSILLNTTICILIVIGGIGFPVLFDLGTQLGRNHQRTRLAVQTKVVLMTSFFLIVAGAALFALLEHRSEAGSASIGHVLMTSLFQSITCRTAGFNTLDIYSLREATLAMMIFLMFIGASPGSCGGGVKTTTLAVLAGFTHARIRRRRRVNMFKKSLPVDAVNRSISLVLASAAIICIVVFLLLSGDVATGRELSGHHGAFLAYVFETVSAFATVGLSMGVTSAFSAWSKLLLIVTMLIGRVGVLTFSYLIVGAGPLGGKEHAEQNLMIG